MKPPPRPDDWRPPPELPDLRRVGIIAIDTETNDEGIRADRGSAWPWRDGYICGISVAWRDESGIRGNYFPLRHPDSENFECENVIRWLKDHIAAGVRIVTQNGLYDWGWLWADLGLAMPPSEPRSRAHRAVFGTGPSIDRPGPRSRPRGATWLSATPR